MNLTPLDIISAHPWQNVAFTTYALSLSFFEAVILDALARGRSAAQPLVLADVHGVRECLSEQGACRVGTYYEVEPLAVAGGVFHPKITVLASDAECHLLVGSGNLTINGWGGNCEVIEHLHPSFAADAIADAAEFFERLSVSSRVRHGISRQCLQIASGLRRAIPGNPRRGNVRFLHNLDNPLIDQIAQAAADLGGARRLAAAAPFWDSGTALDALCQALGVSEAFVHAHAKGCVTGAGADNWPRNARTSVHAVRIELLGTHAEAGRRLHAKMFEICCRRGRIIVSGSANGTGAALDRDRNVEACVLRVQRNRTHAWRWEVTERPRPPIPAQESVDEKQTRRGVLRAALQGDTLIGQVFTPRMNGAVSLYHLASVGSELLADTVLGSDGAFSIMASNLEKGAWRGGRLVIRVIDASGQVAEGFVSLAGFAEVARRGGAFTRRLLALIFGSETPEDVTAILAWFSEDPGRLSREPKKRPGDGSTQPDEDDNEQFIPVASLKPEPVGVFFPVKQGSNSERHWRRFLDQIFAAFREPRGPFVGDDNGDDSSRDTSERDRRDCAIDKTLAAFNQLFGILTRDGSPPRDAEFAFDLTGFICTRLRPDKQIAREWLKSVIHVWLTAGVHSERRLDVAAAVLTVLGTVPDTHIRWARNSLLRLGYDLTGAPPPGDSVRNYQTVLLQQKSFADLWMKVAAIRTYPEQVRAYLKALDCGEADAADYADLPTVAPDVWPILERALRLPQSKRQLLIVQGASEACPCHHIGLPKYELDKLRTVGIATTKNCCGRVIIKKEA